MNIQNDLRETRKEDEEKVVGKFWEEGREEGKWDGEKGRSDSSGRAGEKFEEEEERKEGQCTSVAVKGDSRADRTPFSYVLVYFSP